MSVSDGDDDALRDLRAELEATKKDLDLATRELELVKKADVYSLGNSRSGINDHIHRVRETFPDPFAKPFHSIIIFGAEGNLSMKKTFPALFALMRQRHFLPERRHWRQPLSISRHISHGPICSLQSAPFSHSCLLPRPRLLP